MSVFPKTSKGLWAASAALCTRNASVSLAVLVCGAPYLTALLGPCVMARYVYPFMLAGLFLLGAVLIPRKQTAYKTRKRPIEPLPSGRRKSSLKRSFPPKQVSPAPMARAEKPARKPCCARLPFLTHMSSETEQESEGCGPPTPPMGFIDKLKEEAD